MIEFIEDLEGDVWEYCGEHTGSDRVYTLQDDIDNATLTTGQIEARYGITRMW